MKTFKELKETYNSQPADDMTMKELKIACVSARNILDMLEQGQDIKRWQISAIVKASEELSSVYTSLLADDEYPDYDADIYGLPHENT